MRLPLIRKSILLPLLCCWCLSAMVAPATAAVAHPQIVSQSDCFAGKSYDEWMGRMWERNSLVNYILIRLKFPEAEYEHFRKTLDCRAISYRSDGHIVLGWLVRPKRDRGQGKLPVIIYNRGGNRSFGVLTFAHLFSHVFPLAERGYLVAASQYRGATSPQDSAFSPDQFGGDDVHDVTNLTRVVAKLPRVDPRNMFMIGQSRGAIMTFRALLETPVPIRAVAIYSGAYDLHDLLRLRPAFDELFALLIPDYRKHREVELDRRSVTRWAERLPPRTGVLMFHGDEDERAPLVSARKLARELKGLGRPHRLVVYPGESHFLDGIRADVREQTLRWFAQFAQRPIEDHGKER